MKTNMRKMKSWTRVVRNTMQLVLPIKAMGSA